EAGAFPDIFPETKTSLLPAAVRQNPIGFVPPALAIRTSRSSRGENVSQPAAVDCGRAGVRSPGSNVRESRCRGGRPLLLERISRRSLRARSAIQTRRLRGKIRNFRRAARRGRRARGERVRL